MTMRKNKAFSLLVFGVFAVVVLMSLTSAAFTVTPSTLTKNITSGTASATFDISVNNDGAGGDYALTWVGTTSEGTLVVPTLNTSTNNTNQSTTFSINSIPSTFVGTITGTLTAQSTLTDRVVSFTLNVNEDLPTEITDCEAIGMPASTDVRIKKIDFNNNGIEIASSTGTTVTFGEDDKWFPFENIEATIEVKNYGDYDADNVEVSWGVWDTDSNSWVIEPDNEKDFKLDHGDTETLSVEFSVDDNVDMDLEDLRDGSHYKFYVYLSDGVVDDSDSPSDGLSFCAYDSQNAEMVIEGDFVILTNVDMPESVQCGQTIDVTANVWNIGDRDQDEVSLYVEGSTASLGLAKEIAVGDMDAFDSQRVDFSFTVPDGIEERSYNLNLEVRDEDKDVYENDFDDDLSEYSVPFVVEGCAPAQPTTTITATLVSGGKAGKDLVVRGTITNTGDELETYTVSAAGFAGWASAASVDQSTLVLNPGQSRDVTFTFPVLKDVSGEQLFYIEAVAGSDVTRQPVSVTIEQSSFLGLTGDSVFGGNGTVWLIGLLNIILIVVIIVVAVRIARR